MARVLREIMEQQLLFAPLPTPRSRWKSFVIGWGIQIKILIVVLALNALFPQQVRQAKKYVIMNLVAPVVPTTTETQPLNPRLQVKIKPDPARPMIESPRVAKLVVLPQERKVREPEPDVKAPEIKVAFSLNLPQIPKAPLASVVATNTFAQPTKVMPTTAKPAAQVQTGGFGDSNGIPATGDGKHAVNVAAKGNPGLPSGEGFGNGFGGSKGTAGVGIVGNGLVQSSGFDKQAAAPLRRVEAAVTSSSSVPEIISKPKPNYTEEGRKAKVEGEVRLEVLFAATGQAHVVRVLQGLGYGLDEQAVRAAERIKFKPAQHEGQPVDSRFVVHIIFELAS
jgi:TonB family protein